MDRTKATWTVLILLALAMALGGGGTIGASPPFKTDKLAVLVVEESAAHASYTSDQLNIIQSTDPTSVKVAVESRGGQFQVIDLDTADNLQNAPKWVADALAVKRDSVPWIVGATPRSGFSVPLAAEADVKARVEGLR